MKICILTIATNKYIQFVQNLYDSIDENFLKGNEIQCLLFTEHEVESSDNVKVCNIKHEPWPMPTLKRYNYFLKEEEYISQFDYCFYFDVDMKVVAEIYDDEVIGDLVAVNHPYKINETPDQFSYERRSKSLAYVPLGQGTNYYAGGFNGGSTKEFLKMSKHIANNVITDTNKGMTAIWHDESHLNRYLIDNPPTLSLTPSYCYPEEFWKSNYPHPPKIVALSKNHNELRS
jgi:histo-blood group ABO system transferase